MTNHEYIEAMQMRRSRRTFLNKAPAPEVLDVLKQYVDWINETAELNFVLFESGKGLSSMLSGSFALVAVCGPDTQKAREDCGYFGEQMVLEAVYSGLGTCWLSSTFKEEKIFQLCKLPKKVRLYAAIAFGYVRKELSAKEKMIRRVTHKTSKPYQKMFTVCDEKLPDEYVFAMQQVENAPSSVNRQPVLFQFENGVLHAGVPEPYSDQSIDFGIAKFHFETGMREKGINGRWTSAGNFETGQPAGMPEPSDSAAKEGVNDV